MLLSVSSADACGRTIELRDNASVKLGNIMIKWTSNSKPVVAAYQNSVTHSVATLDNHTNWQDYLCENKQQAAIKPSIATGDGL